jgi:hypothetical protein
MATRAIIAVERAQGWRGRYAHWDNYPERMVGVLGALVERDGITQVVTTLINDNASWSVIDHEQGDTDEFRDEKNIRVGYGIVHDDIDKDSDEAWYTEETGAYSWAQFVYVMRRNGVSVYTVESGENNTETLKHLACHTWEEAKRHAGIGV